MIDFKNIKIKKFLSNKLFKHMFWSDPDYKDIKNGDIINFNDQDLFEYDDSNGNFNWLKNYYKLNGFWNYIKRKGKVYNIETKTFEQLNSQGYNGDYYKNGDFRKATKEETDLFKSL